jgi:hypothetical protein
MANLLRRLFGSRKSKASVSVPLQPTHRVEAAPVISDLADPPAVVLREPPVPREPSVPTEPAAGR